MINDQDIKAAINAIAALEQVYFDAQYLVEDVVGVAAAFPETKEFAAAISSTVRMLQLIKEDKINTSTLMDDYHGWQCCHYQHKVAQGAKATMRIMFKSTQKGVYVKGFGERRRPADFYRRMAALGRIT